MLNPPLYPGGYYHIYNRGVEKRSIFLGKRDYLRFLDTLDYYRKSPLPMKLSDFKRGAIKLKKVEGQEEIVRIFCYCLMPNHFHLLVQQLSDNGLTQFLRKLSDSYTRFFNTKYERIGPLFQGTFKAKLIESEEYLLQLSKYIHRNSFPLDMWEAENYPYSSYPCYLSNKKHSFCDTDFILSYFSRFDPNSSYREFVEENDSDDPTLFSLFIDPEEKNN